MKETLLGVTELFRLSWAQSPAKLVVAVLLKLTGAAALPLSAPALGALTDAVVAGDLAGATAAAVVVALLAIAALTLAHFAHVLYFELGEVNFLTKERGLIELINGSPGLEHLERPEYADKMQVLRQEMRRVSYSSMEALLSTLSVVVAMAVTVVLLVRLDPLLALLPLTAVPPILLGRVAENVLGRARDRAAQESRRARHLFSLAVNAGAAKEVRVAGVERELRTRHVRWWNAATAVLWPAEVRAALLRIAGQVVFAIGYITATLLVLREAVSGRRTVGDVVLVVSLAALVNNQVATAVTLLQDLQRVAKALSDYRWVAALIAARGVDTPDRTLPDRLREGIRLRQVGFSYPDARAPVLSDADLLLPAGSTVAIVGENGAGKTTLVKLLCRFYEPTEGRIEVDGVDLRRLPLSDWRDRIAAGFQDFARFEFTARETVGVGDLPRIDSEDAVRDALARAHTTDVLDGLANGLGTQLGKSHSDGTELSGGQWQKLALGRAMMRTRPLLLVLDEPTAALDAESEHLLFQQYAENAKRVGRDTGAVTVLVSHRFSTVHMADLILVVADGRIAESGDHDSLMRAGGLYAELYGLQQHAYR